MAKIETIRGILKSVDDENKPLEIELDDNVIHVQTRYPETRIPAINQIIEDRRPETYSHLCMTNPSR